MGAYVNLKDGDKFLITAEACKKSGLPIYFAGTIQVAEKVLNKLIDFTESGTNQKWFVVKKHVLPTTPLLEELM